MIFRPNPAIRRLVLALAALQLAVTVAVPLAEARNERAPGPVSVERQHSQECVTLHKPSACVLCQHAAMRSHPGRVATLPEGETTVGREHPWTLSPFLSRFPSYRFFSRGPPPLLG